MKQRGANVFWSLPLQNIGYSVRNYYKFRPGVGTEDDYRNFLKCARKNGFHFWQDIVPHGHFAEYGFMRGVSPFTISIAENGQYAPRQSFDYSSKEWRKYICDVAAYYTKNFQIDGFRIDQPSHSPLNWRRPGFPASAPKMSDPRYWEQEDVVWWNKSLKKWWDDAVAKNGGKIPPVDGQRASSSLCEAGTILTREIRDTVRNIRPNGAIIAETEDISCVPSSDAVFDFYIRRVGLKMSLFDGETTAREFARFLEEQKLTDPPETLRVRFLEVHDAMQQRFTNWCGEKAGRALRSALFWSKGVPMQLAATDVGMGVLLKRLNTIRAALPEFRRGSAEYQAVGSKPSVFAVVRTMDNASSIGISSFLSRPVTTMLDIPVEKLGFSPGSDVVLYNSWTGEKLREGKIESFKRISLDIPAYGNAVLTWRQRKAECPVKSPEKLDYTVSSAAALRLKKTPDEIIVEGTKRLVIDRKSGLLKNFGDWLDGSTIFSDQALPNSSGTVRASLKNGVAIINAELACGVRLQYVLDGVKLKIIGSVNHYSPNNRMAFSLSATNATRWKVNSIEGLLDDYIDKNIINPDFMPFLPVSFQSYRPIWSPILWHSEIKPLNPAAPEIQFFGKNRKGFQVDICSPLSTSYDDIMLFNQLPGQAGLHLAIFWVQPGPLSLADGNGPRSFSVTVGPAQKILLQKPHIVDGVKISHKSMFWNFQNGKYSLQLTRNGGMIKELKGKNGKIVLSGQDIIGGKNLSEPDIRASLDPETAVRCYTENGKLKLRFLSALRNGGNNGLPTLPIWCVVDYTLDHSETVTQSWKLYADTPVPLYRPKASEGKDMRFAYIADQGTRKIEIPVLRENGKITAQEYRGYSSRISASGTFQTTPLEISAAPVLDWKRYYQLYFIGKDKPVPFMIASFKPGNSMNLWYYDYSNIRFAAGHSAPVSVMTEMPGISFFGRYTNLKPGKYILKSWMKGKNIAKGRGRGKIILWMEWIKNGKIIRRSKHFKIPQGSFDWQPLQAEFNIPADAQMPIGIFLRTSFDAYGDGTVWADFPELCPKKK